MNSEFSLDSGIFSSSRELGSSMNYRDHLHLVDAIQKTALDLQRSPLVTPEQTDVRLKGIRLPSLIGHTSTMSLEFSTKAAEGLDTACIQIADSRKYESVRYDLSDITGCWEERHPESKQSVRSLEHSSLMIALGSRLDSKMFEELMDDVDLAGIDIALLLARHLRKSATEQTRRVQYAASDMMVDGEGLTEIKTFLSNQRTNDQHLHKLGVATLFCVGHTSIEKDYIYKIASTAEILEMAGGQVTISGSADDLTEQQFRALAKTSHEKDDPKEVFYNGLQNLAEKYDITR